MSYRAAAWANSGSHRAWPAAGAVAGGVADDGDGAGRLLLDACPCSSVAPVGGGAEPIDHHSERDDKHRQRDPALSSEPQRVQRMLGADSKSRQRGPHEDDGRDDGQVGRSGQVPPRRWWVSRSDSHDGAAVVEDPQPPGERKADEPGHDEGAQPLRPGTCPLRPRWCCRFSAAQLVATTWGRSRQPARRGRSVGTSATSGSARRSRHIRTTPRSVRRGDGRALASPGERCSPATSPCRSCARQRSDGRYATFHLCEIGTRYTATATSHICEHDGERSQCRQRPRVRPRLRPQLHPSSSPATSAGHEAICLLPRTNIDPMGQRLDPLSTHANARYVRT